MYSEGATPQRTYHDKQTFLVCLSTNRQESESLFCYILLHLNYTIKEVYFKGKFIIDNVFTIVSGTRVREHRGRNHQRTGLRFLRRRPLRRHHSCTRSAWAPTGRCSASSPSTAAAAATTTPSRNRRMMRRGGG